MHYPNHMRTAFCEWIESGQPDDAQVEVNAEPTLMSSRTLLRHMVGCTDTMPRAVSNDLDMPAGESYGSAAAKLLRDRGAVA